MPNPNVNYVYEITVQGRASGQAINNVFHYDVLSDSGVPPNSVSMQLVAQTFRGIWVANILSRLHTSYEAVQYTCRELTGQVADPFPPPNFKITLLQVGVYTPVSPDAGLRVGDPLPTYCAVTVRKETGLGGRGFRGSTRYAPIIEADTTGNSVNPGIVAAFAAAVPSLQTWNIPMGGQNILMGLGVFNATRVRNALITQPISVYNTQVLSFSVNTFMGSQISRKQRAGIGE